MPSRASTVGLVKCRVWTFRRSRGNETSNDVLTSILTVASGRVKDSTPVRPAAPQQWPAIYLSCSPAGGGGAAQSPRREYRRAAFSPRLDNFMETPDSEGFPYCVPGGRGSRCAQQIPIRAVPRSAAKRRSESPCCLSVGWRDGVTGSILAASCDTRAGDRVAAEPRLSGGRGRCGANSPPTSSYLRIVRC